MAQWLLTWRGHMGSVGTDPIPARPNFLGPGFRALCHGWLGTIGPKGPIRGDTDPGTWVASHGFGWLGPGYGVEFLAHFWSVWVPGPGNLGVVKAKMAGFGQNSLRV